MTPLPQAMRKRLSRISSSTIPRVRKQPRRARTSTFLSTSRQTTPLRSRNFTTSKNIIALPSYTTTKLFGSSRDQRKATRRRNGSTNYAPNWAMLRCSRPYRFHRTQRKKPKRTEVELPEVDRPGRVHRITKRPCLHRTAIARFRRRLRSRRILLLRLNLWRLCQARAQAPILRALPEHRLPPKSPPYRRLESLTCDNSLPRDLRLPWVSRRAGKTILSPGLSHHCGPDV